MSLLMDLLLGKVRNVTYLGGISDIFASSSEEKLLLAILQPLFLLLLRRGVPYGISLGPTSVIKENSLGIFLDIFSILVISLDRLSFYHAQNQPIPFGFVFLLFNLLETISN